MPALALNPGGGFFREQEIDFDAPAAAHDAKRVLDVFVDLEVQGHLIRMVGEHDRTDAFYGEQPNFLAQVAMTDQVQASAGKSEKIRIDFAPPGSAAGGGEVTHLRRAFFVDRLRDQINGLSMLAVIFVRADADREYLFQ